MELPFFIEAVWVNACLISLLSVAFSLTHVTDRIPNFALGGIIGTGSLINWMIAREMELNPYLGVVIGFLAGGVINSVLFSGVIERITREGRSKALVTLATFGAQFVITALNQIWWFWVREQRPTVDFSLFFKNRDVLMYEFRGVLFFSAIYAVAVFLILRYVPRMERGKVFVAFSENPELAAIQGIDVRRVRLVTWFISGGLAGSVGAYMPLMFHSSPSGTYLLVTAALAGCFFGGINNPVSAMLGGALLGFSEILITILGQHIIGVWVGEFRPLIPVLVLSLTMYLAPEGVVNQISSRISRKA